ncbi:hypothetical protein HU200_014168 [Digitaria exilis]|uniref:Chalcone synthase n=1 Tax=Digitaria exilis TaxID=1010633 RepID=A0A835FC14_9POAL|nr:hypothetical protein HU200_014168 [Digitaria exilis]
MVATKLATVHEIRRALRADGPAAVLAIGTANPTFSIPQDKFPDYYFRVTKEHLTDLKDTFTKLCRLTGLERRFFHHTEQMLNANPSFFLDVTPSSSSSSLVARLDIVAKAAPELAATAAAKAIAMWGLPATDITDLIVATSSEDRSPGTDLSLATLLGLRADVLRTSLQLAGCSGGCAALRLAKDLAENNRGARVLVACVELTLTSFRGPGDDDTFETLIPQALFGVVIAADPELPAGERAVFEMVAASQTTIPGTERMLNMRLGEGGIKGDVSPALPSFAAEHLERCLAGVAGVEKGKRKWNEMFWVVHPGSRGILDHIDVALGLEAEKLAASRAVVREYGNMMSATVIFVLDEVRRGGWRRKKEMRLRLSGESWWSRIHCRDHAAADC